MINCEIYVQALKDEIYLDNGCNLKKCNIEQIKTNIIEKCDNNHDIYKKILLHTDLLDMLLIQNAIVNSADINYYGISEKNHFFSLSSGVTTKFNNAGYEENLFKSNLLNGNKMESLISKSDIIVPLNTNLGTNVKEELINRHQVNKDILETLQDIILRSMPSYKKYLVDFWKTNKMITSYCFIMKRELFFQYLKWSNNIIKELLEKIQYNYKSVEEMNFVKWSLIVLLNLFCIDKEKASDSLSRIKVIDIKEEKKYQLNRGNKDEIPILYCFDNKYVPYFAVSLYSLMKNANKARNYKIIIFEINIGSEGKKKLISLVEKNQNFSIEFINVKRYVENKSLYASNHFTIENYLRLLAPVILNKMKKIIYLDSDLIIMGDISELYEKIDVEKYLIGACKDYDVIGQYNASMYETKQYLDYELCLVNPYNYFQSGVMIINIEKFLEEFKNIDLIDYACKKDWRLVDQDVLNVLCEENVYFLDDTWNVYANWVGNNSSRLDIIKCAPIEMYDSYKKSRQNPKIIHYAGYQKPWNDLLMDFADEFWQYAKETPYYEVILNDSWDKNQMSTPNYVSEMVRQVDNHGIKIKGIDEPIYVDGIMIKAINVFNKKYPIGSKKRDRLRKIVKRFVK